MEANPPIDQGVLGLAWLTHHGSQGPEPGPVHVHSQVRRGERRLWREELLSSLTHRNPGS